MTRPKSKPRLTPEERSAIGKAAGKKARAASPWNRGPNCSGPGAKLSYLHMKKRGPRPAKKAAMNTSDPHAHLREAHEAGAVIQANHGTEDAPQWDDLADPKFTCPPHLYRVKPE